MAGQTPSWLQQQQHPFVLQQNPRCHLGHVHPTNRPAAGFVLVRMNESAQLELLLDLRSEATSYPDTWGFITGVAADVEEEPLTTAYQGAEEKYGITADELNILGFQYKHDHGGVKYLTYTYIFAQYDPPGGQPPRPRTTQSERSQWFPLASLPNNLIVFLREDGPMLEHVLKCEVVPMLKERAPRSQQTQNSPPAVPTAASAYEATCVAGDIDMGDAVVDTNAKPIKHPPHSQVHYSPFFKASQVNVTKTGSAQHPIPFDLPVANVGSGDSVQYPALSLPSESYMPNACSSPLTQVHLPGKRVNATQSQDTVHTSPMNPIVSTTHMPAISQIHADSRIPAKHHISMLAAGLEPPALPDRLSTFTPPLMPLPSGTSNQNTPFTPPWTAERGPEYATKPRPKNPRQPASLTRDSHTKYPDLKQPFSDI
ncbi:hypothetical protein F4802DRAFT_547921 [Xylaria palmicola]|nr:hypothetical protein F4802DRAFT_547921 [Xylaria palmicola]